MSEPLIYRAVKALLRAEQSLGQMKATARNAAACERRLYYENDGEGGSDYYDALSLARECAALVDDQQNIINEIKDQLREIVGMKKAAV